MYIPTLTQIRKEINPTKIVMMDCDSKRIAPGSKTFSINEATENLAKSNQIFAYSSRWNFESFLIFGNSDITDNPVMYLV